MHFAYDSESDSTRFQSHHLKNLPQVGLEPTTFGLEVQRAIHCATGAVITKRNEQNMNFILHHLIILSNPGHDIRVNLFNLLHESDDQKTTISVGSNDGLSKTVSKSTGGTCIN